MIGSAIDTGFNAISAVSTRALAAVPTYGKISSALFVLSLLRETYVRFSPKKSYSFQLGDVPLFKSSKLNMISSLKRFQIGSCILESGYSWKLKIPAGIIIGFLPSQIVAPSQVVRLLPSEEFVICSDRPFLNAYLACGKEVLNIASKVIQSVATGVVAQKMWNSQTNGNIRVVVTSALLTLSAWNIYNVKTTY